MPNIMIQPNYISSNIQMTFYSNTCHALLQTLSNKFLHYYQKNLHITPPNYESLYLFILKGTEVSNVVNFIITLFTKLSITSTQI